MSFEETPVATTCPQCGHRGNVPTRLFNTNIRCNECGYKFYFRNPFETEDIVTQKIQKAKQNFWLTLFAGASFFIWFLQAILYVYTVVSWFRIGGWFSGIFSIMTPLISTVVLFFYSIYESHSLFNSYTLVIFSIVIVSVLALFSGVKTENP